jgi:protein-S-isoprenylcysteine O-methyltransferase Ste14
MRQLFLPPVAFLGAILSMVLLHFFMPLAKLPSQSYHWSGVVFILLGLLVTLKHARLFSSVGTEINTFRTPQKLVQRGMFKHSRNPMYLGFAIALVGTAGFLGSASTLFPLVAFIGLASFWYIPFEEKMMHDTFGLEYASYRNSVRRWI